MYESVRMKASLQPNVDTETEPAIRWEQRIGTEGLEDLLFEKLDWSASRTQQLLACAVQVLAFKNLLQISDQCSKRKKCVSNMAFRRAWSSSQ